MRRILFLIFSVFILNACEPDFASTVAINTSSNDKVILIAKIQIVPTIVQNVKLPNDIFGYSDNYNGNVFVYFGNVGKAVDPNSLDLLKPENFPEVVPIGQLSYIEIDRSEIYMNGATLYIAAGEPLRLPGGLRVDVPEGATHVYAGTIRYSRDPFYKITDVDVIDEFSTLQASIKSKLGPEANLVKSLFQ